MSEDEPKRNPISGELIWPKRGTWPLDGSGRKPVTVFYCLSENCGRRRLKGTSDWTTELDITKLPVKVKFQMGWCEEHDPDELPPFED